MSDPRRPALERDVDVHPRNPNGGLDYFGMLAMALGMAAMLTRMKVFAYGAIIAQARTKQTHTYTSPGSCGLRSHLRGQASSLATQPFADRDFKVRDHCCGA